MRRMVEAAWRGEAASVVAKTEGSDGGISMGPSPASGGWMEVGTGLGSWVSHGWMGLGRGRAETQ